MFLTKLVKAAACSGWQELRATIHCLGGSWRGASKCKMQLNHLQARLAYMKLSRVQTVKRDRHRAAQFVKNGDVDSAFCRAEQILEDENMIHLYDLLHDSCRIVLANMPYIRRHMDCPNQVNQAVSTLAYAAPRCRDLPELQTVRLLFAHRYGLEGLMHGGFVNLEVKERLDVLRGTVSYDAKRRKVSEIIGEDWSSMRRRRRKGRNSSRRFVSGVVDVTCGRSNVGKLEEAKSSSSSIARASSMPELGQCCRSENDVETMKRTISLPSMLPSHVHPKLPDCDDLEEKFKALKREHMMMKRSVEGEPIMYISCS